MQSQQWNEGLPPWAGVLEVLDNIRQVYRLHTGNMGSWYTLRPRILDTEDIQAVRLMVLRMTVDWL